MFVIVDALVAVWEAMVSNRTWLGCLLEVVAMAVVATVVFVLVS